MPENICFICNSSSTVDVDVNNLRKIVSCPRCKKYEIDRRVADKILDRGGLSEQQIANISSWIYHNDKPIIDQDNIDYLLNLPTPTVGEKARRFLAYIIKQYPTPGFYIKYIKIGDPLYLTITGCYNGIELTYIIKDYLFLTKKYLLHYTEDDNYRYIISPEGWAYIESLQELNPDSQIGFIAMWFDKKLDPFLHEIEKAILDAGYKPLRIDKKEHNNNIDDEIIASIRQSKFVVADFTGHRGGVYFEAGYAKGLGLEVVWLCNETDFDNLHFDTEHYSFIKWSEKDYAKLKKDLSNRIISTIGKGSYSPL